MDAIVICGGFGTRVREITKDEIPKIMIPIGGRNHTFLSCLIRNLYDLGVRNIVFAAGFKADLLEYELESMERVCKGVMFPRCFVVKEDEVLDTGGAVLNALNSFLVHTNPFIVINGDTLARFESVDCLEEIYYGLDCYVKYRSMLLGKHMEHNGQYGTIDHMPSYRQVNGILPPTNEPSKGLINCGWYFFRNEFFAPYRATKGSKLYDARKLSLDNDMIERECHGTDMPVYVDDSDFDFEFLEIGTPDALEHTRRRLAPYKYK